MLEALEGSGLGFVYELAEGLDGFGGSCGCGERLAWGADGLADFLFLDEPSVSELLLRWSPLLLRLFDLDREDPCLLKADCTAAVTL